MIDTITLLWAVALAGVAWCGSAVWIVVNRIRYDRVASLTATDAEQLSAGALDPGECTGRRLTRVAGGTGGAAAGIAARELVRRDGDRLLRAAARSGYARTAALRVLVRGGAPEAFDALRGAAATGDADVVAATVSIAAEQKGPEADAFLLDALVEGRYSRSRVSDQLVPRARRLRPRLLKLAAHSDPAVRYWALMLLGGAPSQRVLALALRAAKDPEGQVRGAAARALGSYDASDVTLALRSLLGDDLFFVRAHAARSAAQARARALAPQVAALLADPNWWVRSAAKESLPRLGGDGLSAAGALLGSDDRFARDGAAEVLLAFSRSSEGGYAANALLHGLAG